MKYPTPKKFIPKNPKKYIGDVENIVARSSLEERYMRYFDNHPSIMKWSSEELIIPYRSPIDRKIHRYFPDFIVQTKTKTGKINIVVIEIKPKSQTTAPTKGKKRQKTFLNEVITWETNRAKWQAAEEYCKKKGLVFQILTEHEIKLKW